MSSRKHIQSELQDLNSSLPFDMKEPVFDVPQGYFENFASGVLAKIKGELSVLPSSELESLSPLLAGLSRKMPYSVPDGYFSGTDEVLQALVRDEPLPDVLLQAGKQMPYEVPTGYFEQVPEAVIARIEKPKAKVVPLFGRQWVRYAAAAIITGFVVLGGLMYLQQDNQSANGVSEPSSWVAKTLKNVSNQELDEFLNSAVVNGTETARQTSEKPEARKLLQDVSTSELDAFLSQVPTANDDFTLIN